jgi:PRTRC genetic system ThiF family protein
MAATVTKPQRPSEHLIPNELLTRQVRVVVVGCGGTGSAIAGGLPYLHQAMLAHGHPGGLHVTLMDADRISETNCVRQPFSQSEVGLHKATVLANRANLFWGMGWDAVCEFVDERWAKHTDLVIGCVDTRAAREKIMRSEMLQRATYYLDLGNSADRGQFVLGQPAGRVPASEDCLRLPTVAELFPEIVDAALDRKDRLPSCSAVEALNKQEPFVNQCLAYHALAMLARLLRYGRLSHHGGFVNIASGKMQPLPVDPEVWARMTGSGKSVQRRKKAA